MKSRDGKSQRREEKKKEDQRRESQKKEDAGARKVRTVVKHCVFPMICGSGGSKSRLAKAAGAEPSGQMRDEKLHAVVARSTCRSQNVQNTSCLGGFWKLRCRKSVDSCGAKHIAKSKCTMHTMLGPVLEVDTSKKCTSLWREAHFQVKMLKAPHARTIFEGSEVILRGRHKGFSATCQKWAKREGFVAFPKTMAHVGHLNHMKRIWKDACRMAGAVQKTCSSEMLGGQGTDFLRGVAFWSIRSSGLLRWFCVTGAVLRMTWHHFSWQAQYFSDIDRKNSKTHWYEAVSSALNFPFLEVSQNSFVFDVVKFKSWGSLAELLHFWCCQIQKLRKSRRIASFSNLQIGFIEIDR